MAGVSAWHTGLVASANLLICTVVIEGSGVVQETLEGLGGLPFQIAVQLELADGTLVQFRWSSTSGGYDLFRGTYAERLAGSAHHGPRSLRISEPTIPIGYQADVRA